MIYGKMTNEELTKEADDLLAMVDLPSEGDCIFGEMLRRLRANPDPPKPEIWWRSAGYFGKHIVYQTKEDAEKYNLGQQVRKIEVRTIL